MRGSPFWVEHLTVGGPQEQLVLSVRTEVESIWDGGPFTKWEKSPSWLMMNVAWNKEKEKKREREREGGRKEECREEKERTLCITHYETFHSRFLFWMLRHNNPPPTLLATVLLPSFPSHECQDAHTLIPGIWEYSTLYGKGELK